MSLRTRLVRLAAQDTALRPHLLRLLTADQRGEVCATVEIGPLVRSMSRSTAGTWAYKASGSIEGKPVTVFTNDKQSLVGVSDEKGYPLSMTPDMKKLVLKLVRLQAAEQQL